MDENADLLEMQCSVDDSVAVHTRSEQPELLTEDDLSPLVLTDEQRIKELVAAYESTSIPVEHVNLFKQHLLQRLDAWFVEVADVGLVYLTGIVPGFVANLQVIFWDKKFGKDRRELVQKVLATGFEEFALTRVNCFVPETNVTMATVALRKIGFTQEGTMRKAWRDGNFDVDMLVFGLLKEEVLWQPVEHLKVMNG